jgi:hypothetical protein
LNKIKYCSKIVKTTRRNETDADLFSKVAGTVRGVQDLIVEHREVESKTKPNGVGRGQI